MGVRSNRIKTDAVGSVFVAGIGDLGEPINPRRSASNILIYIYSFIDVGIE